MVAQWLPQVAVPTSTNVPALSLCFPYEEIANRSKLFAKWPELSSRSTVTLSDVEEKMTVRDVFEMSPPIQGLFDYCLYRKPWNYDRFVAFGDECLKKFQVFKFFSENRSFCHVLRFI